MFDPSAETGPTTPGGFEGLLRRANLSGVPPTVAAGVAVLVIAALVFAGARFGSLLAEGRPDEVVFEAGEGSFGRSPEGASGMASADGSVTEEVEHPGTVWVHVAGSVARPGLCELESGSRVGDAIDAAGGPVEDAALHAINLARILSDGEQVYVPTVAEIEEGATVPVEGGAGQGPSAGSDEGLIDLNTATESELTGLPGVGPATAAKIVSDREANGPFASPEEIMRVSGIGEKKYEAMSDLIVVR